jgi:hypothetical protein
MSYELIVSNNKFEKDCIKWIMDDGTVAFIPTDPANSDYQAYLKYLEENN